MRCLLRFLPLTRWLTVGALGAFLAMMTVPSGNLRAQTRGGGVGMPQRVSKPDSLPRVVEPPNEAKGEVVVIAEGSARPATALRVTSLEGGFLVRDEAGDGTLVVPANLKPHAAHHDAPMQAVQTGEVKPRAIIILPKRAPRKTDDEETVKKVVAVAK